MIFKKLFFFILITFVAFCSALEAAPLDRLERLVMPGKLSIGHAKYEKDCTKCHKRFQKGAQNDRCMACHKVIAKDVKNEKGLHGKITDIDVRKCSSCHREHNGRNADIVPFDRDTFDHRRTNFALHGTHARLGCSDCHNKKEKYRKVSTSCIGCHKEDDAHHERLGEQCNNCHVETIWGEAYFNHKKTDFELQAMHKNVRCIECHPNERYKKTPQGCMTCHRLDDVHETNHGKKCEDCHTENMWSEILFEHNKDTKYKLRDRHAVVSCQACHKGDVYKKLKKDCYNCHEKEDSHNQLFGKKCKTCHVTKAWKKTKFNHTNDTDFELKGKHRKVTCIVCHKGKVYDDLDHRCVSCHKLDDIHVGQEGNKCEQCHNETSWSEHVFFDHDLTSFPLLDSHRITPCEECHLSSAYKNASTRCKMCHLKDDKKIHKQRLGLNCELCHNSNDWKKWFFDHNKQTDYKLDGAHTDLDCHACHRKVIIKDIKLDDRCFNCHEDDDHHLGAFGEQCEQCHVTESFTKLVLQK